MKILGIETSCDETSVAVVENGVSILSNIVSSSLPKHAQTGGIIPEVAARQQLTDIIPALNEAFSQSHTNKKQIDAIAVTAGPGLIGSLLVGVETAKTLATLWDKPLIPVNHLPAHIYANWISAKMNNTDLPEFSAISLVVSGGHTDLIKMESHSKITWLGSTRDDAAGEAFDKTARILGLGYPGGPAIGKNAQEYFDSSPTYNLDLFPRPIGKENNYDWSFSGLKTSVLRYTQAHPDFEKELPFLAANIQEAIVDVLVSKTLKALDAFKPKSLILAGGVSANFRLKEKFIQEIKNLNLKVKFFAPLPALSTDNAAAIASWAYFNQNYKKPFEISVNPELTILQAV
jgi:N6-L-threonylcarbamoyladenine synthase